MAVLRELRIELGWSAAELARRAKINRETVNRAENGDPIRASKAKAIATALSKGLRRSIRPNDIEGLVIL